MEILDEAVKAKNSNSGSLPSEPRTTYKVDSDTQTAELSSMVRSWPGKGEAVPHNPKNPGKGTLHKETPDCQFANKEEEAVAKAWTELGYDVIIRKPKNSLPENTHAGEKTADFEVIGIGYLDAYAPGADTQMKTIIGKMKTKGEQSGLAHIYSDMPEDKFQQVLEKCWRDSSGRLNNIIIIFHSSKDGKVIIFKRSYTNG